MLPNDPMILLSTINTKLRNQHDSLKDLCLSLGYETEDIINRLAKIDFHYNSKLNQFK